MRPIIVVAIGFAAASAIGFWLSQVEEASFVQRHVPAECSWKEVRQEGLWEQTCDPGQERLQR